LIYNDISKIKEAIKGFENQYPEFSKETYSKATDKSYKYADYVINMLK